MAQIIRDTDYLHPILRQAVKKIEQEIIGHHRVPLRLFETARTPARQLSLYNKRKARNLATHFYFDIEGTPPIYSTAFAYVYFDGRWSWDVRNRTVRSWYELFGQLVLDCCPVLEWGGNSRRSIDYTYFKLDEAIRLQNSIPAVRMKGSGPDGDSDD